jgi:cytochrome c peroxidase
MPLSNQTPRRGGPRRQSLVREKLRTAQKTATIPGVIRILWLCMTCVCACSALADDAPRPTARPGEVALGRALFNDPLLSSDGTMACVTCHVPEQGFTLNGSPTAMGRGGKPLRRNAPSLLNVGVYSSRFLDGRATTLEQQVWGPLLHEDEMSNPDPEALAGRLRAIPRYQQAFNEVFGEDPAPHSIARALAAFERDLSPGESRFDNWYFGKHAEALSAQEQAGFTVFLWSGCDSCHRVGARDGRFTDNQFHSIGLGFDRARRAGANAQSQADAGRMEITRSAEHRWQFRTPSLRNVALTAPYMHDGSLATLRDVVDWYNEGGGEDPAKHRFLHHLGLSETQKLQLIAFLRSLTGENAEALAGSVRGQSPPR